MKDDFNDQQHPRGRQYRSRIVSVGSEESGGVGGSLVVKLNGGIGLRSTRIPQAPITTTKNKYLSSPDKKLLGIVDDTPEPAELDKKSQWNVREDSRITNKITFLSPPRIPKSLSRSSIEHIANNNNSGINHITSVNISDCKSSSLLGIADDCNSRHLVSTTKDKEAICKFSVTNNNNKINKLPDENGGVLTTFQTYTKSNRRFWKNSTSSNTNAFTNNNNNYHGGGHPVSIKPIFKPAIPFNCRPLAATVQEFGPFSPHPSNHSYPVKDNYNNNDKLNISVTNSITTDHLKSPFFSRRFFSFRAPKITNINNNNNNHNNDILPPPTDGIRIDRGVQVKKFEPAGVTSIVPPTPTMFNSFRIKRRNLNDTFLPCQQIQRENQSKIGFSTPSQPPLSPFNDSKNYDSISQTSSSQQPRFCSKSQINTTNMAQSPLPKTPSYSFYIPFSTTTTINNNNKNDSYYPSKNITTVVTSSSRRRHLKNIRNSSGTEAAVYNNNSYHSTRRFSEFLALFPSTTISNDHHHPDDDDDTVLVVSNLCENYQKKLSFSKQRRKEMVVSCLDPKTQINQVLMNILPPPPPLPSSPPLPYSNNNIASSISSSLSNNQQQQQPIYITEEDSSIAGSGAGGNSNVQNKDIGIDTTDLVDIVTTSYPKSRISTNFFVPFEKPSTRNEHSTTPTTHYKNNLNQQLKQQTFECHSLTPDRDDTELLDDLKDDDHLRAMPKTQLISMLKYHKRLIDKERKEKLKLLQSIENLKEPGILSSRLSLGSVRERLQTTTEHLNLEEGGIPYEIKQGNCNNFTNRPDIHGDNFLPRPTIHDPNFGSRYVGTFSATAFNDLLNQLIDQILMTVKNFKSRPFRDVCRVNEIYETYLPPIIDANNNNLNSKHVISNQRHYGCGFQHMINNDDDDDANQEYRKDVINQVLNRFNIKENDESLFHTINAVDSYSSYQKEEDYCHLPKHNTPNNNNYYEKIMTESRYKNTEGDDAHHFPDDSNPKELLLLPSTDNNNNFKQLISSCDQNTYI